MRDLERELRVLGEKVRDEVSASGGLGPNARSRIRLRRIALAAGGLVTALALATGTTFAFGAFSKSDGVGPAEGVRDAAILIDYRRTGGIVDKTHHLTIRSDRTGVIRVVDSGMTAEIEFELDDGEMATVETAVGEVDWRSVDGSHMALEGVAPADGFQYELRHDSYRIVTESGAEPEEVSKLITFLDAILDDRRSDETYPRCGPPVDFKPTYLPEGWIGDLQPDSGGGGAWRGIVGHYGNDAPASTTDKAVGGFADLIAMERPYAQGNKEKIRVLDKPATLGDIHEGYSVEFSQHGCDYFLIAFGVTRGELGRFAVGLRLPGTFVPAEPVDAEDFSALWPEDTAVEAEQACQEQSDIPNSWRDDALSASSRFANEVLGWSDPRVIQRELGHGGQSVEIRRSEVDDGPEADGPAVVVSLNEVATDCWSVVSVSRPPDNRPTGVSISVRGRDVEIGFDDLGADSVSFEMGHGSYVITSEPEPPDGRITVLLNYPLGKTGHFLLLFKDADGIVFSAAGGPLPAGDFVAG